MMKFDSTLYMHRERYYWFYWVYLCEFRWASLHLFMTDGDPDVFLTASHLRDALRHMLFVKTTPVYISYVWNIKVLLYKYLSPYATLMLLKIAIFVSSSQLIKYQHNLTNSKS